MPTGVSFGKLRHCNSIRCWINVSPGGSAIPMQFLKASSVRLNSTHRSDPPNSRRFLNAPSKLSLSAEQRDVSLISTIAQVVEIPPSRSNTDSKTSICASPPGSEEALFDAFLVAFYILCRGLDTRVRPQTDTAVDFRALTCSEVRNTCRL